MNEINFNVEDIEQVDLSIGMGIKEIYPPIENLEVTPTKEQQIFNHEDSYGYDKVTVEAIPDEYIIPDGTLPITENATYDVRKFAKVSASVYPAPNLQDKEVTPTKEVQTITSDDGYDGLNQVTVNSIPDTYIEPSGILEITENGEYDVTQYTGVTTNIEGAGKFTPRYISFYQCTLTTLKDEIESIDVSNVTSMSYMFYNSILSGGVDLSGWNFSKVTDMNNMFYNCKATSINMQNDTTKNVRNMSGAFSNCSSATSLKLGTFEKVTNLNSMCYNMSKLETLDLSGFDTTNVTNTQYMLQSCSKLKTLIINNPVMFKLTSANSIKSSGISTGICTIYVPDDLVATYQADTYWGTYASQIKGISEYTG